MCFKADVPQVRPDYARDSRLDWITVRNGGIMRDFEQKGGQKQD